MTRVLLVYNGSKPNSYFYKNLGFLATYFNSRDYEVVLFATQCAKDLECNLKKFIDIDLYVIAGGDGFLHEFVNSSIDFGAAKILYFPAGTVNDFGYSLGLNKNISSTIDVYESNKRVVHYIGHVNERFFNYVVAFGPFTSSSYQTNQKFKNTVGPMSYLISNLAEFRKFNISHSMKVIINDDEVIEGNFVSGIIAHTSSVAGIRNLFSHGDKTCGYYNLLLITDSKLVDPILVAKALNSGVQENYNSEKFIYRMCDSVKVKCNDTVVWTVDGESGPRGDVNISQSSKSYEVYTKELYDV